MDPNGIRLLFDSEFSEFYEWLLKENNEELIYQANQFLRNNREQLHL